MNQGNAAAGVSGSNVVTLLSSNVEKTESGFRLLRKGSYAIPLCVVELTYVAIKDEDDEVDCQLEFVCDMDKQEVRIYGLRGPQLAISDLRECHRHAEMHLAGNRDANAGLIDYYQEVVNQVDELVRKDLGLDKRQERNAVAQVCL